MPVNPTRFTRRFDPRLTLFAIRFAHRRINEINADIFKQRLWKKGREIEEDAKGREVRERRGTLVGRTRRGLMVLP